MINRQILRDTGLDERIILRIIQKAKRLNITTDRMTTSKDDAVISSPHFEASVWIRCQREHTRGLRPCFKRTNVLLLKSFINALRAM